MKTKDFFFALPPENIAQFPPKNRGESRLMLLERRTGRINHLFMRDFPMLVESGSLVVFNNSRVRKARLYALDERGRKIEFLLVEQVIQGSQPEYRTNGRLWRALAKRAGRFKIGSRFVFPDGIAAKMTGIEKNEAYSFILLDFEKELSEAWLEDFGHVPLPPYIKRPDESFDNTRYQTIYAKESGSAAAPTAGLHWTEEILEALKKRRIASAYITLHVGLGTFLPVRSANVEEHKLHSEDFFIDDEAAEKIENAKRGGQKIIAVGTTALRAMEAAMSEGGRVKRGRESTSIFIYGDYDFKSADMLFTNFHTPESSLLMLASSFCGAGAGGAEKGRIMLLNAYNEAIKAGYNFFSYGDAMLIV